MSDVADNQSQGGKDPTRLCPVCRTPISILAVRCRFCGAEVGRPRKEQETFTVKDLGGEQKSSYTLSGNVTEALEAFMSEERSQAEAKERERQAAARRSLFRRSREEESKEGNGLQQGPGLPELDASSLELSTISATSTRSKSIRAAKPSLFDIWGRRPMMIAAVIAALILLYFGGTIIWPHISGSFSSNAAGDDFIYPNHADEFYSSGRPLVEVMEEAITALKHNNTQENQDIAEKMRRRFIEKIETEAFSDPFDRYKLNSASRDINRVAGFDSDSKIIALLEEVNHEVASFKFILTEINSDNETVVFRLNNPYITEKEQEVAVGDMLQDRFLVKKIISREVRLEDTSIRCTGRQLIARYMESVEALK